MSGLRAPDVLKERTVEGTDDALNETNVAWYGSLLVGTSLAIWILVEILMIGYQPAPPLLALYGLLSVVS